MMRRSALHHVRDVAVAAAAYRPFHPIESPENRIILVRPDHFGDMLMLAPALQSLRAQITDHEVVLMTGPWNEAVARHVAPVDRLVTWEFPGFARDTTTKSVAEPYAAVREAASTVRELQPQAIVLLRDDHWWGALMGREAGVPLRFGYAHPRVERFLTHPLDIPPKHYVEQNREVLRRAISAIGYKDTNDMDLQLNWPEEPAAAGEARRLLERHGVAADYLVVHPGTGAPVKRWPVERWAAVADELNNRHRFEIILTGSPDEADLCNAIASCCQSPTSVLAGSTSLFSLAEVLRQAKIVLGVDSGPLHLATAVSTPSVHLYGPSDSVRYGPWGDPVKHRLLTAGMHCPSCGDLSPSRAEGCGCMMAISTRQVIQSANEVLSHVR